MESRTGVYYKNGRRSEKSGVGRNRVDLVLYFRLSPAVNIHPWRRKSGNDIWPHTKRQDLKLGSLSRCLPPLLHRPTAVSCWVLMHISISLYLLYFLCCDVYVIRCCLSGRIKSEILLLIPVLRNGHWNV